MVISPTPRKSYFMKPYSINRMIVPFLSICCSLIISCSKDNDLFDEYVLADEEEVPTEQVVGDNGTDTPNNPNNGQTNTPTSTIPDTSFESKPNEIVGTFYPKSASEISDPAYANHKAVIETSFDCNSCTFAENLTIETAGGVIGGSNINLNGAYIVNTFKQVFATNTTFTNVYNKSRLSPETFGANGSDAIADDDALVTLIMQSEYAIGQRSAVYIKNRESVIHMRTGRFDWDMDLSTVRTTSAANLSHDNTDNSSKKYLFEIRDIDVRITNGEFDGQNAASRCFYFRGVSSYDVQNVNVHNYYAPPNAKVRGIGFLIEADDNFKGGQILNSTIANIGAASDGIVNNTPYGYAKGILIEVGTGINATHLLKGNTVSNIYGDDAEGFHNTHKYLFDYNHSTNKMNFVIDDNKFIGCSRRALKIFLSNAQISNNTFESVTTAEDYSGNHASLVQVFSVKQGQAVRNVNILNNLFSIKGESNNNPFGINDATDCLIEGNTFQSNHIAYDRGIVFAVGDTQGGLYSGDLSDTVIFRNNTITNLYIRLLQVYDAINGGFIFDNNTINLEIDRYINGWFGAITLIDYSGDSEPYKFSNTTININQTYDLGNLFSGSFVSLGANPKNVTFDNVKVNYSGNYLPTNPFAKIGTPGYSSNFDETNKIINCTLSGALGTGAIDVTGGNANVLIQNSFGDGSTPLTAN